MKHKKVASAILLLSTLVIGACGNGENSAATSSSQEVESSVETTQSESVYQNMYDESLVLYESGKYSEAGGTLELLLQNDLSEYEELETKALELKEKITAAQVETAKEEPVNEVVEDSEYKDERNSVLVSQEYSDETGKDIATVSDEELASWLTEKEETKQTETVTEESESAASESEMTAEEEENYVLDQVIAQTGISPSENQFFTSKIGEDTYQIEIRHSHEVDGVEISNMIGMFEYSLSEDQVKRMNPVTGEYEVVAPQ